jgi:hypothetical protein
MPIPLRPEDADLRADALREVTFLSMHMPSDVAIALGVACGALVYLARTQEPGHWRKGAYFVVSLIGGYFLAKWAVLNYPHVEPWLAGFAASATLVTLAILVLDWGQRRVEPTLDRLYNWLINKPPRE